MDAGLIKSGGDTGGGGDGLHNVSWNVFHGFSKVTVSKLERYAAHHAGGFMVGRKRERTATSARKLPTLILIAQLKTTFTLTATAL